MPRRDVIVVIAIFLVSLIFVPFAIRRHWNDSARQPGPPQSPLPAHVQEGSPNGRGLSPATGPEMTYNRPPLTSIGEILSQSNQVVALATQSVQLTGVPVQQVFSPQYFMVGPDATHGIVVRSKELYPNLKPGQNVNIAGMIQQLGEDLSQWQLDPKNKAIVGQHPIFINAIQVTVNP